MLSWISQCSWSLHLSQGGNSVQKRDFSPETILIGPRLACSFSSALKASLDKKQRQPSIPRDHSRSPVRNVIHTVVVLLMQLQLVLHWTQCPELLCTSPASSASGPWIPKGPLVPNSVLSIPPPSSITNTAFHWPETRFQICHYCLCDLLRTYHLTSVNFHICIKMQCLIRRMTVKILK